MCAMLSSHIRTAPRYGFASPQINLRSVVLPVPFAPITAKNSPLYISSEKSLIISRPFFSYLNHTSLNCTACVLLFDLISPAPPDTVFKHSPPLMQAGFSNSSLISVISGAFFSKILERYSLPLLTSIGH